MTLDESRVRQTYEKFFIPKYHGSLMASPEQVGPLGQRGNVVQEWPRWAGRRNALMSDLLQWIRFAAAVLGLVVGAAGHARADLVVDQQQTSQNGTGLAQYSIGESFTPTATRMDTVEFKLFSEGSTTLQLAILDGLVGNDGLGGGGPRDVRLCHHNEHDSCTH